LFIKTADGSIRTAEGSVRTAINAERLLPALTAATHASHIFTGFSILPIRVLQFDKAKRVWVIRKVVIDPDQQKGHHAGRINRSRN
jgi:hypothetical protein